MALNGDIFENLLPIVDTAVDEDKVRLVMEDGRSRSITVLKLISERLATLMDGFVKTDGTKYMDTGYVPNNNLSVATKVYVDSFIDTLTQSIEDNEASIANITVYLQDVLTTTSATMDATYTPVANLDLVTLEYMNTAINSAIGAAKCSVAGRTTTITSGGIPINTTFVNDKSSCELIDMMLFAYVKPVLSSIVITPGSTVEVGTTIIPTNAKLIWVNDSEGNQPTDITITSGVGFPNTLNPTAGTSLNVAGDGTTVMKNSATNQLWYFRGHDKAGVVLSYRYDRVYWQFKAFWGDTNATMDLSEMEGLSNNALRAGSSGTYTTGIVSTTNVYRWFCFESTETQPTSFKTDGFATAMEAPIDVVRTLGGIARTYKCYRTTNLLSNIQTIVIT